MSDIKNINKINKLMQANGCALYGAGPNGRWCFDYLIKNDCKPICFIDNGIHEDIVNGLPVYSFNKFKEKYGYEAPPLILITAKHAGLKIAKALEETKLKYDFFDRWFYKSHKKNYKKIRHLLLDKKSKLVLNAVIKTMNTGNECYLANLAEGNQYFACGGFFNTGNETFVDLGACTGDTIERFITTQNGAFKKIFAFEPGDRQLDALHKRLKRLKDEWCLKDEQFEIIEAGVSNTSGTASFSESDALMANSLVNKGGNIKVYALDDYFHNQKISFIKCDIEGSEMDFLKGANAVIKRDKPKMALSVYHRPDDLIEMISLIKTMVPEYKFMLRHHSSLFMDVTLYCWCE